MVLTMKKKNADILLEFVIELGTISDTWITVSTGGTVITGKIATPATFFRKSLVDNTQHEGVRAHFESYAAELDSGYQELEQLRKKDYDELTDEERKNVEQPWHFLNLVEAAIWDNGEFSPSNRQGNYRIRISAVDAWHLGRLDRG